MIDVALQGAWVLYSISKDKGDESVPPSAFRRYAVTVFFMKYSKEGKSFSSQVGIWNIPSDVCYDDTKHYRVQYEHRRIQNSSSI